MAENIDRKRCVMKILAHIAIIFCTGVIFLFCGCSVVTDAHSSKAEMLSAYMNGNNQLADNVLQKKLTGSSWSAASALNSGDELMWRLEAGSFYFHRGDFAKSIEHFSAAEKLIAGYDDRARISMRDAGAEIGMAFTNLNALPYRGFCRDSIMLSVYKAMAYLGSGREDAFRAQVKRLRNEQKKIQHDYQEFFAQQQKELSEVRRKNPKEARSAERYNLHALSGKRANKDFAASLKKLEKRANYGYRDFLNPAAIYLSGIVSLRDKNYDNACIDFKRLYEAMPDNELMQRNYATVLQKCNRELSGELSGVKVLDFPLEENSVIVISALGRSGTFKQSLIRFPVMAAWPECIFFESDFSGCRVRAGNRYCESALLADMDAILAREYKERLPMTITRIIISTLIKEAAKYSAAAAVANENGWAGAGVLLAASVYTEMMNTADTRSWEMLPKQLMLAQLPMPEKRSLTLELHGKSQHKIDLQLPEECNSAIIFVSAPSVRNTVCHVFPMTQ